MQKEPPPYTKSFVRPFMFDDYAFTKVLAHFNDKEIEIEETVSVIYYKTLKRFI